MGGRDPIRRAGGRTRSDQPQDPGGLGRAGDVAPFRRGPADPRRRSIGPSAFWTIAPERPLWGSHRFVLRSSLPGTSATEISYPEVAPLGKQGAVDAYLRIMNATGRPLAAEDATGLRRLLPIFQVPASATGNSPATTGRRPASTAWRRRRGPCGSRCCAAGSGRPASWTTPPACRMADVTLTVMPDRSVLGRALYEIVPESGRLLTVELPPGSTILWSAVEPNPAVPLRAGPSAWSIVLDPGQPERVCLIWKTPPSDARRTDPGGWSLPLPRAGPGPVRTLVSVSAPAGVSIEGIPSGFETGHHRPARPGAGRPGGPVDP